jgi:hypothetical protein
MMTPGKEVATKSAPAAGDATPLLAPWLAFVSAGFCFMAAGFRLTVDDLKMYESMNVELPAVLQLQIEWGAKLAVGFVLVGLGVLLLTRWHRRTGKLTAFARFVAHAGAIGLGAFSILVLYSAELIFTRLQQSLQQ